MEQAEAKRLAEEKAEADRLKAERLAADKEAKQLAAKQRAEERAAKQVQTLETNLITAVVYIGGADMVLAMAGRGEEVEGGTGSEEKGRGRSEEARNRAHCSGGSRETGAESTAGRCLVFL